MNAQGTRNGPFTLGKARSARTTRARAAAHTPLAEPRRETGGAKTAEPTVGERATPRMTSSTDQHIRGRPQCTGTNRNGPVPNPPRTTGVAGSNRSVAKASREPTWSSQLQPPPPKTNRQPADTAPAPDLVEEHAGHGTPAAAAKNIPNPNRRSRRMRSRRRSRMQDSTRCRSRRAGPAQEQSGMKSRITENRHRGDARPHEPAPPRPRGRPSCTPSQPHTPGPRVRAPPRASAAPSQHSPSPARCCSATPRLSPTRSSATSARPLEQVQTHSTTTTWRKASEPARQQPATCSKA